MVVCEKRLERGTGEASQGHGSWGGWWTALGLEGWGRLIWQGLGWGSHVRKDSELWGNAGANKLNTDHTKANEKGLTLPYGLHIEWSAFCINPQMPHPSWKG